MSGFPLDDAWIHMVYARSLSLLQGFAYNPGQAETGSTSPLWAIVLVPATWTARLLHVGVVIPAKITTILTSVGASVATARLLRGMGFATASQLAAGLAIAVEPWLAFAQVSGMEVMLAGALAVWALSEIAYGRYFLAGIAAGLASLARPEMAVLAVSVLALAEWRLHLADSSLMSRLAVLLPSAAAAVGWLTYCLVVSGYPFPSTFYVKGGTGQAQLIHNIGLIFTEILPASPWFAHGIGVVPWAIGAVTIWSRGSTGRLFVLSPWLFFLGVAASRPVVSAWAFYFHRYFLPAQVFLAPTFATGVVASIDWAWKRRRPGPTIVAAAVVLAALIPLPSALAERAHRFAWNCQNIEDLDVGTAVWLRDHVPAGESIAVNDAGAARYFGGHRILDIVGLNHHRLLHGDSAAAAEMAHVRYASIFPSLIPELEDDPAWQVIHRARTQHLTICKTCQQSEIVTYRRVLPPRR